MADVFNRTDGRYLQSVNTPDFDPAAWIINPDLTSVAGQPVRYWIIDPPDGDIIRLADAGEQAAIDLNLATRRINTQKESAKNQFDVERVLKALAELLVDEFNTLRALHLLSDRTFDQLRTAIRAKIDSAS